MKKLSKNTKIVLAIFTIFIVILGVIRFYIIEGRGKPIYKIDKKLQNVKFTEQEKNKIIKKIKENKEVINIKVDSKIDKINIVITVNNSMTRDNAKTMANSLINLFSDKQKNKFDLEVFVKSEDKKNQSFPIIGYRSASCDEHLCKRNECSVKKDCDLKKCMQDHLCNKELTWTKDR